MAKENKSLKKWLDKLQEESWNLELIISGFSIFGLFKAKAFLDTQRLLFEANDVVSNSLMAWFQLAYLIVYASVIISIFFLLVHVSFRALWIGAIGIRYVSNEIDYDILNYDTSITNYLKKKIGSFDNYILKLEKASSLIFGYTFLLILILFSVFLYFLFTWIINTSFGRLFENTDFWWIAYWLIPLLSLLLALIICIDIFTGGVLKKIKSKWFVKTYIFFNKVITLITLSFFWKPLYFNLIDQKKTKWLIYFVIPIFALLYSLITINYNAFSVFPKNFQSDGRNIFNSVAFKEKARVSFQTQFYDNIRKADEVIQVMSLPNNKMETKFIDLFVRLTNTEEKSIMKQDSTIKGIATKGFSSSLLKESSYEEELLDRRKTIVTKNFTYYKTEQQLYRENLHKILILAKKIYTVKINGELIDKDSIDILFHQHNNQQEEGFLFLFRANNIKKGMNLLSLEKLSYDRKEKQYHNLDFTIPFIYIGH